MTMEPAEPAPASWLEAVLNNPLSAPVTATELRAVTTVLPPCPLPEVLLSIRAPLVRVRASVSMWTSPAVPGPVVATDILPPPLNPSLGVEISMDPAEPARGFWLEAVLNNPLSGSAIVRESLAVTVRPPPDPVPEVLLSIRAPPATVIAPVSIPMLPAAPAPTVATEILPPSVNVSLGVDTLMEPPEPARTFPLDAVLNNPLLASLMKSRNGAGSTDSPVAEVPEMVSDSLAVTRMSPPFPVDRKMLLLATCPPFVRVNAPVSIEISPARPAWRVPVLM